jgi:CheY-like chemotaxis protein
MNAFEQDVVALEAPPPALLASASEPNAIRVLLIEDGVIDRGFLADVLSTQGFAVHRFNVASLLGAPDAACDADVIILHCDRPRRSGIDLLVKLRRLGVNVPVVLLTGEAARHRRPMNVWLLTEARSTSSARHGARTF